MNCVFRSNSSHVGHLLCIFYHVVSHELCEGGVPGESKELESFFFIFHSICVQKCLLVETFWYLEDDWQSGLWLPGHFFILHNGHLAWVKLGKSAGILTVVKVLGVLLIDARIFGVHLISGIRVMDN